ncbi:MAG TPA: DNA gyrase subunit A [Clostridia bacterium]|jgi:DNA gyrase subunit A|nr:DNA gyrase subunit A [Clostridia bacterium]
MEYTHGKILPINIEQEMKNSYIDYAMSVIVGRALPDVRDGLKPVHRRILYAMAEMGMFPDKPYRKSARIVGDVLGRYHPHGDTAVYEAAVRMAQDFSYRYPLIDGQGNFGSIDGDSAAAMRYTEARLAPIATEMIADINKETVDFVPNFDESLKEPVVLPAKIPNLLINGSAGIAVGMATNIPPHNLTEVIDGLLMMIDKPEISVKELMFAIKGPDFPTGGLIMGRDGIIQAYKTGKGKIIVRAQAKIEKMDNGKSRIVVDEIPYQVNKAKLVEKIAELVQTKKIDGIIDLRDESDRNGMRIIIELRKDANPNVILNQLYKNTQMQITFGIIMLALVNNQPKILNLKELLYYYLEHQKEVITRRTRFDLNRALDRAHILEGLRIALNNLDEVIKIIRGAANTQIAKNNLIERFGLSEKQAQAILDMRLQRLTGLEREKLEQEYQELKETIVYLESVLQDEKLVLKIIKEELTAIREKYGDKRRTKITTSAKDFDVEDLIAEEDIVVTITHQNYIKRIPANTYRSQRRGGRGVTGMNTREEDFVEHLFVTTTHHDLLFFTNKGKMYRLKAYEIPEAGRQAKGTPIVNLIQIEQGEYINAVIPVKNFSSDYFLFMATKEGRVKKTILSDYDTSRKSGLIAITLDENDELIGVRLTDGKGEIILATKEGTLIRFPEEDVRPMGRGARGVKGISLRKGDQVVAMDTVQEGAQLLVITSLGYGKRVELSEFRLQSRGGKGVKSISLSKKIGEVVGVRVVKEGNEVMVVTAEGIIIRMPVEDISIQSRPARGVTVIRLEENDRVVALARVMKNEEAE